MALMTLASLWAIVALLRYHDRSSASAVVAAALLIGVAGLIKPMSVFLTVPAIARVSHAPATSRAAADRGSRQADARLLAGGLLLPVLYYGSEALTGTLVRDQMRMRFEPHLIATAFFWRGLATMASRVETLPLFAAVGDRDVRCGGSTGAAAARGAARRLCRVRDRVHVSHADARLLPSALHRRGRDRRGGVVRARGADSLGAACARRCAVALCAAVAIGGSLVGVAAASPRRCGDG